MNNLNWNLIFRLSLFGLAMAIATVYIIPSNIEPLFWVVIFIICAYFIAKSATGKYFLHGFCVSLLNAVWIVAAHIILYDSYIAKHADEVAGFSKMGMEDSRQMMLIVGPIIGIASGLVLGLFAFIASRFVKKTA